MRIVKKLHAVVVGLVAILAVAGCSGSGSSNTLGNSDSSITSTSPYSLQITVIGSSEISVSKTVQLRSTVTGTTQKDVTWSSADESIASVSDRGLVTGIKEGKTNITATLDLDSSVKATVEITVNAAASPTAITISGATSGLAWIDEDVNLSVSATPVEASALVNWESSNEEIATVSQEGAVHFLSPGNVVIMATSTADANVSDYLEFEVKYGTFYSNKGSSNWDISHQADANNANINLPAEGSSGYNALYFNHFKGQRFYAEGFFKTGDLTDDAWAWQGIGVGTGLSDSDSRFFTFSPFAPGQGNNHNKTIVRDWPTTWGELTDRSQVWGENGLNQLDSKDGIKIAMIRDYNTYYYLINDKLFWVDETTKYADTDTYPIFIGFDIPVTVTNYELISDDAEINSILAGSAFDKSFFTTGDVTYIDDSDFTFNSTTTLSKDHKIRSLGDKTKLYGNFEVSFDVDNMTFNGEKESIFRGLSVNFVRYNQANINESILLGRSGLQGGSDIKSRYMSWDYQKSMEDPTSVIKDNETTSAVTSVSSTMHVKIQRIVDEEFAEFKVYVNEQLVSYDYNSNKTGVYYTGAYLLWVGGEYSGSHVTNFVFNNLGN